MSGSDKRPPSWWWLTGPVVLIIGSVAVFIAMIVWTVSDVATIDARVPIDGEPHSYTVPASSDRMLLADPAVVGQPCVVRDSEGTTIEQEPLLGEFTMTRDGRQWSGLTRFDPGDGRIVVTCPRSGAPTTSEEVVIAKAVDVGSFVARIFGTILIPMVIGGAGLLWGIVLVVLIVTRRRPAQNPQPTYRPPPPPPPVT